jgi:hypothetical protein
VKALLLSVLLLAGCSSHTAWQLSAGTPHPNSQVQVHTGSDLAALLGLAVITAGAYEAARGDLGYAGGSTRHSPEMAPDRRVSEQDCTKPLDYSLGNIRCK